jgi:hypothetical protein
MSKLETLIMETTAIEPGQFTVTDLVAKLNHFMQEFVRVDDNGWQEFPPEEGDEICGKAVRAMGVFFELLAATPSRDMAEVLAKFVAVTTETKRTDSIAMDEENALHSALDDYHMLKAQEARHV